MLNIAYNVEVRPPGALVWRSASAPLDMPIAALRAEAVRAEGADGSGRTSEVRVTPTVVGRLVDVRA